MKYLLQLMRYLGILPPEEADPETTEAPVKIGPLIIHTGMGLSLDAIKEGVVRATAQLQYVSRCQEYRVFVCYYDRSGEIVTCGYGFPTWFPGGHKPSSDERLLMVRRAVTYTYAQCRRDSRHRAERTVLL